MVAGILSMEDETSKRKQTMTTVMVVDDSPTIRAMLTELLKQHGLNVIEAEDGQAAIQVMKETRPDLVITDIVMPKTNGYELCRWVKNELPGGAAPVILCSTKAEAFDKHWGMKQGGDAYITKPYDPEEMIQTVRSLLQGVAT
jgi:twitching motility two-component system response regulator PilH